MNCEVCQVKELEVESFEIREVLRCILHTIVFHRALGLIRPKDIDLELFEITYVQCGEIEVEKKIDDKVEQYISWIEKHPNKKSQLIGLYLWDGHDKEDAPQWPSVDARLVEELLSLYKQSSMRKERDEIRPLNPPSKGLQFESAWSQHKEDPNLSTVGEYIWTSPSSSEDPLLRSES